MIALCVALTGYDCCWDACCHLFVEFKVGARGCAIACALRSFFAGYGAGAILHMHQVKFRTVAHPKVAVFRSHSEFSIHIPVSMS